MSTDKRLTLTEYCNSFNVTVVERQPASAVPAAYRGKPKDQQVMTGVRGTLEVLLSNGDSVFICADDELVFETVNSAGSHRGKVHPNKPREEAIAEHFNTMKEIGDQAEKDLQVIRGKVPRSHTDRKTAAAKEPSNGELKAQLEELNSKLSAALVATDTVRSLYEKLKLEHNAALSQNKALKARVEELDTLLTEYEGDMFPEVAKRKFVELMANAMEQFSDKWLAVAERSVAHKKVLEEIIGS